MNHSGNTPGHGAHGHQPASPDADHPHAGHSGHAGHHPGAAGTADAVDAADAADQSEILDLDAEILAGHTRDVIAALPLAAAPGRILDLGSGTGAGTFALLDRFPDAHVTAVDSSPVHLRRLERKAADAGMAERVSTVRADLDAAEWPDLGAPELVWASASLHHLADPGRALRRMHRLLRPGGLFVVIELAGFPRFLPTTEPADRPGLEDRCHAALERRHAERIPHRGADWGPPLSAAGFTIDGHRTLAVDVGTDDHSAVARYAHSGLARLRQNVAELVPAPDLAALDRLLDPDDPVGIPHRADVRVRTERSLWLARRV